MKREMWKSDETPVQAHSAEAIALPRLRENREAFRHVFSPCLSRTTREALPCSVLMAFLALYLLLFAHSAAATEFKLANRSGERIVRELMTIEGAYIQPIVLENGRENRPREDSDAYFIAHIKAASAHPHGFSKFAWIPYLKVSYTLEKQGSPWTQKGALGAAIGKFGPHYGANVKLDGVGKYRYTVHVAPPDGEIPRLVDTENGIRWWKPFSVSWDFTFLGVGKKGVIGAVGGY